MYNIWENVKNDKLYRWVPSFFRLSIILLITFRKAWSNTFHNSLLLNKWKKEVYVSPFRRKFIFLRNKTLSVRYLGTLRFENWRQYFGKLEERRERVSFKETFSSQPLSDKAKICKKRLMVDKVFWSWNLLPSLYYLYTGGCPIQPFWVRISDFSTKNFKELTSSP